MTGLPKRLLGVLTVAMLGVLVVPVTSASADVPAQGGNAKCPLGALKKADKPVAITFWHAMSSANEETLQRLTDQFNSSQSNVKVTLLNQVGYEDTLEKYIAGLSTGDLPDLVQAGDADLRQMIDTQTVLPAQTCVKADDYDLSDHLERVVDYYTVEGTLWPMPFNVSTPVLYYDKAAFSAAGLDPEQPPTTLDEVTEYSQTLKDSGAPAGFGLKTEPGYLEQWLAKAGDLYVDNGNGRKDRATQVLFENKTGEEIFTWMSDLVSDGLANVNSDQGGAVFDNLFGIGNGNHAMTIETSAALGTITQTLSGGEYADVELGVAPMPGPSGKGGVVVDGAALYIVNQSAPEKQAAAWQFAKFLNQAESQAEWAVGTGYVPIVESAVDLPAVQDLWAREPGYKVAYDQLLTGPNNLATAGPVVGNYVALQDAVREAEQSMFTQGTKPKAALKTAKQRSDDAIQEYNARIGG